MKNIFFEILQFYSKRMNRFLVIVLLFINMEIISLKDSKTYLGLLEF